MYIVVELFADIGADIEGLIKHFKNKLIVAVVKNQDETPDSSDPVIVSFRYRNAADCVNISIKT